jgi:hypothetical protein
MFGPSKISKSLIDAVLKVTEGEVVETQEVQLLDEASEKVPTPTGMKVYGSSYGNSAKARKDQTKSHVDTLKGPKKKELINDAEMDETGFHKAAHAAKRANQSHFEFQGKKYPVTAKSHTEAIEEDGDCVTKPQAKDIAKKEVGKHEKGMHGEKGEVAKHEKKMHKEEESKSFKDRLLEREMTSAESRKKEKIVMSMKDKQEYFKKKYGKRWKEVMYATATKQAMKEEIEEMDDVEQIQQEAVKKSDVPAFLRKIRGDKPLSMKDVKSGDKDSISHKDNLAKARNEEFELSEKNESHTHAAHYENEKGEWTGMNLFVAKDDEDAIKQAHAKCKDGCRLSRVERHVAVKEEAETSVDMLSGREHGEGEHNDHRAFKVKLSTEPTSVPEVKNISKGVTTRARDSIKASGGGINPMNKDQFDSKYAKPNSFDVHTEAKDPETSDAFGGQANFVTNANTSSDEPKKKLASEENIDEKTIAGTPGWKETPKNVKDKSGAVHTPMSRARDLARQAFKKVKTEMIGKAADNQGV